MPQKLLENDWKERKIAGIIYWVLVDWKRMKKKCFFFSGKETKESFFYTQFDRMKIFEVVSLSVKKNIFQEREKLNLQKLMFRWTQW